MTVYNCGIYSTALNSSENLPPYPLDNYHHRLLCQMETLLLYHSSAQMSSILEGRGDDGLIHGVVTRSVQGPPF